MEPNWEEFYANQPKPSDLEETRELLKEFVERHTKENSKIVLVTSGGTTIPLEHNTVRFVDNFSAGTRGAISTEYFLHKGYAVIFMYRFKSIEPFARHFTGQKFLEMLDLKEVDGKARLTVSDMYSEETIKVWMKYKSALKQGKLLQVSFTTLSDYLWILRSVSQALAPVGSRAILYLAAAVSDFYVPTNEMSVHKIGSSTGPPNISLHLVPKILKPLVSLWVPKAFVVSFKLETDESLLIVKAREALNKYKHNLVIANMLQSRRQQVIVVEKNHQRILSITNEQLVQGEEIEKYIVDDVITRHDEILSTQSS